LAVAPCSINQVVIVVCEFGTRLGFFSTQLAKETTANLQFSVETKIPEFEGSKLHCHSCSKMQT